MAKDEITKTDKAVAFVSLWVARLVLTLLALAGMMYFLAGIDRAIAYPIAIVTVAFLVKETL